MGTDTLIGTINGTDVLQIVISGTQTAAAGASVTPTITATLLAEFPHQDNVNVNTLTISGIKVTALEADTDSVTATIAVEVIDDVPAVVVTGATTVAEDASLPSTIGGSIAVTEGADQDASLAITLVSGSLSSPILFTLGTTGSTQSATVTVAGDVLGVLSVTTDANGDATWTFDPALDVTQPASFTFTATVTDKDGDVDTDTHTISITDGADPTTSGSLTLIVDEKDLSDGTTALLNTGGEGGNPDTVDVDTGTLSFTAGSDAITDIRFGDALGISVSGLDEAVLAQISWSGMGTDTLIGTINGTDVLQIVISGTQTAAAGASVTPTITATLLAEFPHQDNVNVNTLTISGIKVTALEADNGQRHGHDRCGSDR